MKAKLTSSEETHKFTLELPMEDVLELLLGKEQRAFYADCSVDIWGDSRTHHPNDEPDKTLTITFYKSRTYQPNAEGLLEEVPKKAHDPFASKADIAKLEERIDTLELGVKAAEHDWRNIDRRIGQ